MTKLLQKVVQKFADLPKGRQDDAARILMLMLEQNTKEYQLTNAQLREVDEAIADTEAGNFAPQKDIDAILNRSWT